MSTLMVMAGGTGGHVMPAMAVADALKAQGWRIVWLVTEGGMENRLIADKDYDTCHRPHERGARQGLAALARVAVPVAACLSAKPGGHAALPAQRGAGHGWIRRVPRRL